MASRFGRRFELRRYREDLQRRGHTVTSRWLDLPSEDPSPEAQAKCAAIDLEDIYRAETLIAFSEAAVRSKPRKHSRGGRWVEYGLALGTGKPVVLVGPRENVFCHLAQVTVYPSWQDYINTLDAAPIRVCNKCNRVISTRDETKVYFCKACQ
jgi:hypothetical protein